MRILRQHDHSCHSQVLGAIRSEIVIGLLTVVSHLLTLICTPFHHLRALVASMRSWASESSLEESP